MKRNAEIDMLNGPVLGKILLYALPLMLSGILQLLFNAADMVVVGQFAGGDAFAAVGASASLVGMLVNAVMGLTVGASVAVAQSHGAGDEDAVHETVHTSMLLGLIGGFLLLLVGFFGCPTFLAWMKTPADVMELSVLYVRVYFLGMPAMMVYNFGASVLRAVGDTRHPLYFLTAAGVVNVLLNLLTVIVFRMSVAGVALATALSQLVSAVLVIRFMMKQDKCFRFIPRRMKLWPKRLLTVLRIGIPSCVQASLFSMSSVVIQSSINSFGSALMQGSAAAANLESFSATAEYSFSHAALAFTGQNVGAKKYRRIPRILASCVLLSTVVGVIMGGGIYLLRRPLLGIYLADEAEAIVLGCIRITILMLPHFLYGVMEAISGVLRGMGASVTPTVLSLISTCFARVVWVFTVFAAYPTVEVLFLCYPLTWIFAILLQLGGTAVFYAKLRRKECVPETADAP